MTTEQLKQNAAAMLAFADGKPVQALWKDNRDAGWYDSDGPGWFFSTHEYRPAPAPVSRPWNKPSEVPVGAWIRSKMGAPEMLVVEVTCLGIRTGQSGDLLWSDMGRYEYSTDRKEWKKCEVTEPAQ